MAHWIATGRCARWEDAGALADDLQSTDSWRLDPRSSITELQVLEDGSFTAECQGRDPQLFTDWFAAKGCTLECLLKVRHMVRTGEVWTV
ncbi:MAG: hypothetical protein ABS76_07615 [Pelagibacterium sp. SCN 64-44]|nr:MAG: hypothetical protein ABS76_07615 [Pelagibacterium sp. SCN 64-44]